MKRKPAKTFQDLLVWQKAHQFVVEVYQLTQKFPKYEMYGLTSQFRRVSMSVPANIAEGFRKRSKADKIRYLNISQGSLEEARYYLILTKDLEYAKSINPNLPKHIYLTINSCYVEGNNIVYNLAFNDYDNKKITHIENTLTKKQYKKFLSSLT